MTDTFKRLSANLPSTSFGPLYTVPGSTQTIVKHMRIVNTSTGTPGQLTMWHGAQSNVNLMLPINGVVLQPGEWSEWDGSLEMSAGDVINALQTVANIIAVSIYGDEIS